MHSGFVEAFSMREVIQSAVLAAALIAAISPACAQPGALDHGALGLYEASEFRAVDGRCADCAAPKPALWYFEGDLVAIPKNAQLQSRSFSHQSVAADVRDWAQLESSPPHTLPFMSWLGSPELLEGAKVDATGTALKLRGAHTMKFAIVPKISSNRSYFNPDTAAFFSKRSVRVRGATQAAGTGEPGFVARVLWPEDFRIEVASAKLAPLRANESLTTLMTSEDGGAKGPFTTRLLWRSASATPDRSARRAVLAFMLNGAQGDDDEAHGGHFAVVTGWHRPDGQWADWTVNNFYNLGSFSEKGIIASMLPMDNYMMDLNSGQAYYRPSYMLVAILKRPDAATWYQSAIGRVFDRLYRHHIEYDHAMSNCAGLSLDTLSGLGWRLPTLGATSRVKATLGYFYSSATDLSFASGKRTFHYMTEERSRLYPRAAFETVGQDLLALVSTPTRVLTRYEQMLRDDVEAVVFVRIPQIPSSRAFGTYPVASFDEYMARVPKDRKDWKIIPVDARPFPEPLRDPLVGRPLLSDNAVGALAVGGIAVVLVAPLAIWRKRAKTRKAASR
jgi:hypothetical protein